MPWSNIKHPVQLYIWTLRLFWQNAALFAVHGKLKKLSPMSTISSLFLAKHLHFLRFAATRSILLCATSDPQDLSWDTKAIKNSFIGVSGQPEQWMKLALNENEAVWIFDWSCRQVKVNASPQSWAGICFILLHNSHVLWGINILSLPFQSLELSSCFQHVMTPSVVCQGSETIFMQISWQHLSRRVQFRPKLCSWTAKYLIMNCSIWDCFLVQFWNKQRLIVWTIGVVCLNDHFQLIMLPLILLLRIDSPAQKLSTIGRILLKTISRSDMRLYKLIGVSLTMNMQFQICKRCDSWSAWSESCRCCV